MKKSIRNFYPARARKGQGMVEFALSLMMLLLLVFGLFEFARLMQAYVTIRHAAREGARYAVTGQTITGNPDDRVSSIIQITRQAAEGLIIVDRGDTAAAEINPLIPGDLDVSLDPADAGDPDNRPSPYVRMPITVTVTYNFFTILPRTINVLGFDINIMPNLVQLQVNETMIVERIDYVTPEAFGTLIPTPGP